jgi:enoyl-CoA hydratase/3-hydroxyacyl-CoA dehydrogenase
LDKLTGGTPPKLSGQDVVEFVFFPVINEGCRVIAEGIVDKPADLDVATVMAMGFPAPRGGLIFWADLVGAGYIVKRLQAWEKQFDAVGLGGFFKPCAYLERVAREGKKLEAGVDVPAKL